LFKNAGSARFSHTTGAMQEFQGQKELTADLKQTQKKHNISASYKNNPQTLAALAGNSEKDFTR